MKARTRRVAAAVALLCAACGPRWDPEARAALEGRLRAHPEQRLERARPYVLPWEGSLLLFLCRWSVDDPIPVAVRGDPSPEEEQLVQLALDAWEQAGLGVRFLRVEDAETLEIRFVDGAATSPEGPGFGHSVVDCAVDPRALDAQPGQALVAELVSARVRLARQRPEDVLGRQLPLGRELTLGTALHELGHALGFQGHLTRSESIMLRSPESLERIARRVLSGQAFSDPSLAALYALPSGTLVRRAAVSPARTDLVDRMARLAAANELEGPFVRVGDAEGRVFWRTRLGVEYGLVVPRLERTLEDPGRLVVLPEPRTRRALR